MAATPNVSIPQGLKPVLLYQGAANAVACDVVSLKNVLQCWIQIIHSGANDTDLTLSLYQATDVAAGTNKAAPNVPYWLDADAGTTSDTYVRQTDGKAITIDPATQNAVMAIFQVDPAALDVNNGYDCVYFTDSGGHASNVCTIVAYCLMRDQQATPATVITD